MRKARAAWEKKYREAESENRDDISAIEKERARERHKQIKTKSTETHGYQIAATAALRRIVEARGNGTYTVCPISHS